MGRAVFNTALSMLLQLSDAHEKDNLNKQVLSQMVDLNVSTLPLALF